MPEIDALSQALEAHVRAGRTAGCVALVVDADGVLHESAHGLRAAGSPQPMTPDSVFQLASMTKAIGSAAAMLLVESGRLSLDAPVETLLPELAAMSILEGFDGDAPVLRANSTPITLRHLLHMASRL